MDIKRLLILAAGLAMVLSACEKKDPVENTREALPEEQMAISSILLTLTGQDVTQYEGRTYDPIYGEIRQDSNPTERSVKVQSAAFSESYFYSLAGLGTSLIQETAEGLVLDLTACKFGKLTFYRTGTDNSGYVDVEIPCIPKLARISFKTQEQWGDNASSIYKYGEVLKDAAGNYYVVVSEAASRLPGWLVCMKAGRGNGFHYYRSSEPKGAWLPNRSYSITDYGMPDCYAEVMEYRAIQDYIALCSNDSFRSRKKQIVDAGYDVFPAPAVWTAGSESSAGKYEGFSTTRQGFSHYLGTKTVGVRIMYVCKEATSSKEVEVQYVYLPGDSHNPTYQKTKVGGGWSGKPGHFYYKNEQGFEQSYFTESEEGINASGSVAVYTAYILPFSNENHPDLEKVKI